MPYGTIRASVSKPIASGGKFQIRTRTATMGVRGTEFIVQSDMGSLSKKEPDKKPVETKITVVQGKVEVTQKPAEKKLGENRKLASVSTSSSSPIMLTAGTQLTASSSGPVSKPVTLDAAQLSAVTSSTNIMDNTFSKAITLDVKSDPSGGGGGGDSSAGQATRAALAQAITARQSGPAASSNSGFIGTFSANTVAIQPTVIVPVGGGLHTLHIVVKQ